MSSITKNWTEEDFRRELRKIDKHIKETQGIELEGAKLDIVCSTRVKYALGTYYSFDKKFRFSLAFFNSDVPEACAIDVIRHEYAHYYTDVVMRVKVDHGAAFKTACRIVGANPSTYYSRTFEAYERKKEADNAQKYVSKIKAGTIVIHPAFGEGRVLRIENNKNSAVLSVDFVKVGLKKIDEVWLKKHGTVG